ncbi:FAD dependent oxidoreductase-domain-containing protein [Russula earlei]|uniref:FAD dependent oxidoreductase-domain-containing protein n=1 Tax=Russula earlei TaxID=71964 RepID=A0ACC0TZN9_9AGAM|nr:FAD dependent oxidoreductase-domain-containing protein [Russula earlei]
MILFHVRQLFVIGHLSIQSLAAWSPMTFDVPLQDPFQAIITPSPQLTSHALPVSNSTPSFWMAGAPGVNPLARVGSTGTLTADADICIIGSGITGVSVAYHLSKLFGDNVTLRDPLSVVILEARDFCSGATGRNGGHLTPHSFIGFKRDAAMWGIPDAIRAVHIEEHVVNAIVSLVKNAGLENEVDLVDSGRTILFLTGEEEEGARDDYELAKAAGINVSVAEWLLKDEAEKRYGAQYPGVRTPGNTIWPLKLVTHLFKLAQNASSAVSLKLHTHTPVVAVRPLSGDARRWQLETPRGSVRCTHVVHATNAYASALLPQLSGRAGIVPTRGQVIAIRPAVPTRELTLSGFTADHGLEYWFMRPGSPPDERPLVILGGARLTEGSSRGATTDDSVLDAAVGRRLRNFLAEVFPGNFENGVEPEMEWTGIMGFTELGDPFVGPVLHKFEPGGLSYEGQYIAAGFSGHGMPRAFGCADVLARIIAFKITNQEWELPPWFPLHYLTTREDSHREMCNIHHLDVPHR